MRARLILFALVLLCGSTSFSALVDTLTPQGYVTDAANILETSQRAQLEQQLQAFEQQYGTEIAVVTIPSLEGDTIESVANRLFTRWGIGQKGKNNGLLLLLAVNDHRVRIEVGYGLEGLLNDALAGDIIREQMVPAFKESKYSLGIQNAVTVLMQILQNPEMPRSQRTYQRKGKNPLISLAVLGLLVMPFASLGTLLFFFVGPLVAPISPLLRLLCLLGIPMGLFMDLHLGTMGWANRGRSGGYWGGGGFGGGYGGGGGFGGFSGGSSGGGGASGSW